MSKKDIKIFVSHRIDMDAEVINNPLYVPVRCGAIFDDKNKTSDILGDDTGDNISNKRMSFCELTVLYWAWKNQRADYYGLCHYRRYLSFLDNDFDLSKTEHDQGCVSISDLLPETINKYNLKSSVMQKEIEKYDAIFMKPINLKKLGIASNYEAMKNSTDYHNIKDVNIMMDIIKEKYPQMYETAYEYMYKSETSYLYNCFIMKANIFNEFCEWFFDILFDLENKIDMSKYTQNQYRAIGTIGERLVGIYEKWLQKQNKYKIKHTPLLFVENSNKRRKSIKPAFDKNNIPIVSNFNDKYASVFSVFLSSVIYHSTDNYNYDFIILSDDISENHKNILRSMLKENMSIRFVSVKQYLSDIKLVVNHPVYSSDLYYRIIIPQILENYDKLIVVDADMICCEDIANVYSENINEYLVGGCLDSVLQGYLNGADPSFKPYAINYMNMDDPYQYINTGLLLFNAKKYREMFSLTFLQYFIKQHISMVKIYEQDMLNMLCYKKVKFLDPKWNCYTKSNDFIKKCFDLCPLETYQKYELARKSNKGILHYAAHPKPWWDATVDFSYMWWKYAKTTPCYEELLQILINKQSDVTSLRSEFINLHFPNINNHFNQLEKEIKNYSMDKSISKLNRKKTNYRLKSIIYFWKRNKYRMKTDNIKKLIKQFKQK